MSEKENLGTSLDLYILFVQLIGEDRNFLGYPEVLECWTEIEVENNPKGHKEACMYARDRFQGQDVQFREVVVPTFGVPEVFKVVRVQSGDVRVVS